MEEETEDEHFIRTGVFKCKLPIKVKVTEEDLLKDLVQRTVNVKLKIDEPKGHENN